LKRLDSNGNGEGSLPVDPPFQSIADLRWSSQGFAVVTDPTQGLIYLLDSAGKCFATLVPPGCRKPGGISALEDQLFVIDQDQNRIFHYQWEAAPPQKYRQSLRIKKADLESP
jgi:sugar lactone lactonase YvrE